MIRAGIAMLMGMLVLLANTHLPPAWEVVFVAGILTALFSIHRKLRFLLFAVFGFLWVWCCAQHLLATRLAPGLEGKDLALSGWVVSIPQPAAEYLRFRFQVETLDGQAPGAGIRSNCG